MALCDKVRPACPLAVPLGIRQSGQGQLELTIKVVEGERRHDRRKVSVIEKLVVVGSPCRPVLRGSFSPPLDPPSQFGPAYMQTLTLSGPSALFAIEACAGPLLSGDRSYARIWVMAD
jgi:hypothetical protein